jgi:hypothetical protein
MKKILLTALPLVIMAAVLPAFTKKGGALPVEISNERDSIGNIRLVVNSVPVSPDINNLKVRVQIAEASTDLVVHHSELNLVREKNILATSPISLKKGKYKLVEFYVTTRDGRVSDIASQVNNEFVTLPALFSVKH